MSFQRLMELPTPLPREGHLPQSGSTTQLTVYSVYRSRSLMQSYNLYHADTPFAVSGSQNISFSFDSGELTQRIDRKFHPSEYWSWATPSNDDFDHSLVVHGGENGFACYTRGNNQVWLPTNLASGYTDDCSDTTIVYDPVFDITIIFDSSSQLPHIIRAEENHMIYGPSTNDLYLSSYKTVEGIKFPHIIQTVYNSSTQKLDAVIEDYIIEEIAVNPGFPNDFFSGLPDGEGFFPKTAPRKVEGFTHDRITEFSSNGLWSGLTNSTVAGIKHDQPVLGLPNTHWLTLDDDTLGVKQFIIEFEDHVIVGDAPPQWTKEVILWIEKNIQKPIKYLWPTHHHRDHSGGASQYVKLGAKLIVPEVAAKYWASIPNAELILFNETHPYVYSDDEYQVWFLWEKEATHAIDFSYAFISDKCPTDESDVAVIEADVWHPGMPDAQNDRQLMREWLNQVDKDGVPDKAYVLPTHGQVRHIKELTEHADYVYPPKGVKDWMGGGAVCSKA
ncbi:unnamed protein product [Clonostachys chloroleuca]|uniref:Metallo-beta-lactamase domain-containing protein n=1 Tax=Clonostachys chloroleuca TaxID=1926264 RepID=A0AA35LQE3_9HYPO|nr:unnamed protein product [Clonostachys chloroleuca]